MLGVENQQNNFGYSAGTLAKPFAQRPTRAALGTLFISTDTLLLYRWTGTTWVEISAGGGTVTGANNGLQDVFNTIGLGGSLDQNTTIVGNAFDFEISQTNNLNLYTDNTLTIGNAGNIFTNYDIPTGVIKTQGNGQTNGYKFDYGNDLYYFGKVDDAFGIMQFATANITMGNIAGNPLIDAYFQASTSELILNNKNSSINANGTGSVIIGDVYNRTNNTLFTVNDAATVFTFANGNVLIGTGINNGKKLQVDGEISTHLGTAALPTYTFDGDLDTGMYSSVSNTIEFSCAGTRQLRLNNAGIRASNTLIDASTSGSFKIGLYTAGVVVGTGTVKIEINGVVYRLLTST